MSRFQVSSSFPIGCMVFNFCIFFQLDMSFSKCVFVGNIIGLSSLSLNGAEGQVKNVLDIFTKTEKWEDSATIS